MCGTDIAKRIASHSWIVFAFLVGITLLAVPPSAAVENMTGTWMLQDETVTDFVDVVHEGNNISFTYRGTTYTGTVSDMGDLSDGIEGQVSDEGTMLTLAFLEFAGPPPDVFPITSRYVRGDRCECVDGNTIDGDGCDADCQVESCWACTGSPSVCTPFEDGAACNTSTCVTGGTCEAGACTNGHAITSCIDMTGEWVVERTVNPLFPEEPGPFEYRYMLTVKQRRTSVRVGNYVGNIDPETGAVFWTVFHGFHWTGLCGEDTFKLARNPFGGSVAAHGFSFRTAGYRIAPVNLRCPLFEGVLDIGVRAERALSCPGDCDGDGLVRINELTTGTNLTLDRMPLEACPVFDRNFDERVGIDELVGAVFAALAGCDAVGD